LSPEGSDLVRISESLLLNRWLSSEARLFLFWGHLEVKVHFCPSWIPRWLQGELLRAKTDVKMEAGMPSYFSFF
jgi:hypothetical protein